MGTSYLKGSPSEVDCDYTMSSGPSVKRVLVAEDNPVNQKVAAAMLARLGYQADLVSNGREAVELLSRVRYDAVLMDCQMPEKDGYRATEEIRRREDAAYRVPIIAMTADAMTGDAERCLAAGMDDHVAKPVDMRVLGETLQRWIAERSHVTSMSTLPSAPGMDAVKLEEIRALDIGPGRNAFAEWAGSFLNDATPKIAELRRAVSGGDAATVEDIAHYLLGASAHIGATAVADVCGELDAVGRSRHLAAATTIVDRLETELDALRHTVDAEIDHLTTK
ncbi:MAG: response regulator [Actinomycetota bacterium]|nr:response regulator [Actinomycetota bacterium]